MGRNRYRRRRHSGSHGKIRLGTSLVRINALQSAAEAACLILSVDETIRNQASEKAQPGPKLPLVRCRERCVVVYPVVKSSAEEEAPGLFVWIFSSSSGRRSLEKM